MPHSQRKQHLNRLAPGVIVGRRREGTSVIYSITDATVTELCDLVCGRLAAQTPFGEARSA